MTMASYVPGFLSRDHLSIAVPHTHTVYEAHLCVAGVVHLNDLSSIAVSKTASIIASYTWRMLWHLEQHQMSCKRQECDRLRAGCLLAIFKPPVTISVPLFVPCLLL